MYLIFFRLYIRFGLLVYYSLYVETRAVLVDHPWDNNQSYG